RSRSRSWARDTSPTLRSRKPDVHATGTDCDQGEGRPHAALHLVGTFAHASVSHRDLAADEPARRKRSGRGDDDGVRARAGDTSPGYLCTVESGDLSGATGASGGDSEGS